MRLNVTHSQTVAIFGSMDFDGNNQLTLPEFLADFKDVTTSTLDELIRKN